MKLTYGLSTACKNNSFLTTVMAKNMKCPRQMLEIVNRIAGILYHKQDHIDDILKFMHKLCDNLNRGRPDFVVRALRETEGIFCMDIVIQEALALHSFANTVMKYVEEDFCKGGIHISPMLVMKFLQVCNNITCK